MSLEVNKHRGRSSLRRMEVRVEGREGQRFRVWKWEIRIVGQSYERWKDVG